MTRVERLDALLLELRDLARESESELSQSMLTVAAKGVASVILRERQEFDPLAGIELDEQGGVCNWSPSRPLRS